MDKLIETEARNVVKTAHKLTANEDRRLAEAIIQVPLSANETVFDKMKGGGKIDMTLMEFIKCVVKPLVLAMGI